MQKTTKKKIVAISNKKRKKDRRTGVNFAVAAVNFKREIKKK